MKKSKPTKEQMAAHIRQVVTLNLSVDAEIRIAACRALAINSAVTADLFEKRARVVFEELIRQRDFLSGEERRRLEAKRAAEKERG